MSPAPSRNRPCPCRSGKLYKRCCLKKSVPDAVLREFRRREEATIARRAEYGHVRDIVSGEHQGYRFVAVWSELFYSKHWRVFPDFLQYYIKVALTRVFGDSWAREELAKPVESRHPILRWFEAWKALRERTHAKGRDADGLFSTELDGPSAAYLSLAYDLYVVAHHGLLETELVRRMGVREKFRSARYELAIVACMIRAGCDVALEDEKNNKTRHPELVATHKPTGVRFAVEAKSRFRSGVVEWKSEERAPKEFKLDVQGLVEDAMGKQGELPLVVFVDINLPATVVPDELEGWWNELTPILDELTAKTREAGKYQGKIPLSALFFTNIPHDHGRPGERDPKRSWFFLMPESAYRPIGPIGDFRLLNSLEAALKQYGRIPSEFPAWGS
jgi:hypothetical protein